MNIRVSIFFFVLFGNVFSQGTGVSESQFFKDSLYSKSLNEQRILTVYLPAGYDTSSIVYPVIYTTDGQLITESYRHRMDSLIANNLVRPFVLIGSHSNETLVKGGLELRNYDYLPGNPKVKSPYSNRFEDHMFFFTRELLAYIESHYRVSQKPEERTFYGISNGADFGVSLALAHSDQFKRFIVLSIFQGTKEKLKWKENDGIYLYLGYGLKEEDHVSKEALRLEKYCIKKKVSHTLVTWNGEHVRKYWEITFVKALLRLNEVN